MDRTPAPRLFEAFGVEIEHMIVRADTLDVLPVCDEVVRAHTGAYDSDVDRGAMGWSNELALHVLEFKTLAPATTLAGLADAFQREIHAALDTLGPMGATLMPGAMHPWMDPNREMRLWPHENSPVYEAFNRVFDCTGHGWANLQSAHLNLPFRGDDEFGRLHGAIRLVLPMLPALAASSPVADGKPTGLMDTRLDAYRNNSKRVPSVAGCVIPERVFTQDEYENTLLAGLYRDIAPFDPGGVLRHEWLNARGAIARFDRSTIEIRVLDVQECPLADLAVVQAATAVVRALVEERWCGVRAQQAWDERRLSGVLLRAVRDADEAAIGDEEYVRVFGADPARVRTMRELWSHLLDDAVARMPGADDALTDAASVIVREGCLARRIVRAAGPAPTHQRLREVYGALCERLAQGRMFRG